MIGPANQGRPFVRSMRRCWAAAAATLASFDQIGCVKTVSTDLVIWPGQARASTPLQGPHRNTLNAQTHTHTSARWRRTNENTHVRPMGRPCSGAGTDVWRTLWRICYDYKYKANRASPAGSRLYAVDAAAAAAATEVGPGR